MNDIEQQLSALVADPEFQALQVERGRFHLFEALSARRGELRHSNFLAFVLFPVRNHGFGPEPLLSMSHALSGKWPVDVSWVPKLL